MTTASHARALFQQEERKEVSYLLSKEFLRKSLLEDMSIQTKGKSQYIAQIYLKENAKTETIKLKTFLEDDLWKKWEKREDYNALHRWLHSISPIVTSKPNTKDKI